MDLEIRRLCDMVRVCGYEAHQFLRHGHLEKIYENSLVNRLRKQGIEVEAQIPLDVWDEDGTLLGHFVADLLIENKMIVEIKACRSTTEEHVAQLLGYLRSCRIEHGLLVNFGAPKFYIKKYILTDNDY